MLRARPELQVRNGVPSREFYDELYRSSKTRARPPKVRVAPGAAAFPRTAEYDAGSQTGSANRSR